MLQVVHELEDDHEHVPTKPIPAKPRHRRPLIEARGHIVDVSPKERIAAQRFAPPVGPKRRIRPTLEDRPPKIPRVYKIVLVRTGGLEPANHESVDRNGRIGHRDVDAADAKTPIAEDPPDVADAIEAPGAVHQQFVRAHVVPLEIENPVPARLLAGKEARPSGRRDGRGGRMKNARAAGFDGRRESRQAPLGHQRFENVKGRAIQPNDQDFGSVARVSAALIHRRRAGRWRTRLRGVG